MKKYLFPLLVFILAIIVAQPHLCAQGMVTAEISLIASSGNELGKQTQTLALSFYNNSDSNIFIGDIIPNLLNSSGEIFNAYKNGIKDPFVLSNSFGLILSGRGQYPIAFFSNREGEISDPPSATVAAKLYNKYFYDSVTIRNTSINDSIVKEYAQKHHLTPKILFFLQYNCLFLKARSVYKYYFVAPAEDLFLQKGDYVIKYEPKLDVEHPSFNNISQVLSYKRIFPKKIDCTPFSIKIIPSDQN